MSFSKLFKNRNAVAFLWCYVNLFHVQTVLCLNPSFLVFVFRSFNHLVLLLSNFSKQELTAFPSEEMVFTQWQYVARSNIFYTVCAIPFS